MLNKNYIYAPLTGLCLFTAFSFLGFGVFDYGVIMHYCETVKDGAMPYRDFLWLITPLTLYTQAFLEKIFFFISPQTVSMLWKGLTFSLLVGVFLVYFCSVVRRLTGNKDLPVRFLYLYSLLFMVLGPAQETHVGYTPDAIFFACLGVLLVTWPGSMSPRFLRGLNLAGYLCMGLSFGYKQEIGGAAIGLGVLHALAKYLILRSQRQPTGFARDVFIPVLVLFSPAMALTLFFAMNGQLQGFLSSIFVWPLRVKTSTHNLLFSLLTFGTPSVKGQAAFILLLGLMAFFLERRTSALSFSPQTIHRLGAAIRILFWMGFALLFVLLMTTPNPMLSSFLVGVETGSSWLPQINRTEVFAIGFLLVVWTVIFLTVYATVKLFFKHRLNLDALLYFVIPLLLFLGIFDAAALISISPVRGPRIIAPLLMAATLVAWIFLKGPLAAFRFRLRTLYPIMGGMILLFIGLKVTGFCSSVLVDPIRYPVQYCPQLHCFLDSRVAKNMKNIKDVIDRNPASKVFVYQADAIFYAYLNKPHQTFSVCHVRDFYPREFDNEEIGLLENRNVDFVITSARHRYEDSFLFRRVDPIRNFIETHYQVVLTGPYVHLWSRRDEKQ